MFAQKKELAIANVTARCTQLCISLQRYRELSRASNGMLFLKVAHSTLLEQMGTARADAQAADMDQPAVASELHRLWAEWDTMGCEMKKERITTKFSIAARGAEPKGRNPAQGSRGFGAPQGPRNSTPRFGNSGSPPSRGPLEARKGSQKPRGGSSEASERCIRFQRSRKIRWATQRPLRGVIFPDGPERVPTLGLLSSGHR